MGEVSSNYPGLIQVWPKGQKSPGKLNRGHIPTTELWNLIRWPPKGIEYIIVFQDFPNEVFGRFQEATLKPVS